MALATLNLAEPIVAGMVTLLTADLNDTIDLLNATESDAYAVPHAVQILPYVPVPSVLQGGMPAVGVQEIGAEFVDDLQFSADAVHEYAVVAILQHSDHMTLTLQLRRMAQAIAYTVQQDRMKGNVAGSGGTMRLAGAMSVNLGRTEPGPLLADLDPVNADAPPRSFLSWTALTFNSRRREI